MFKLLKKRTGFTLPEMLIAAFVMGVIGTGVVKLSSSLKTTAQMAIGKYDEVEITAHMRRLLLAEDSCYLSLQGKTANSAVTIRNSSGNIYYSGQTLDNLKINSINLRFYNGAPPVDGFAEGTVEVSVTKFRTRSSGDSMLRIPQITVYMKSGVVAKCFADSLKAEKAICAAKKGVFDSTTFSCRHQQYPTAYDPLTIPTTLYGRDSVASTRYVQQAINSGSSILDTYYVKKTGYDVMTGDLDINGSVLVDTSGVLRSKGIVRAESLRSSNGTLLVRDAYIHHGAGTLTARGSIGVGGTIYTPRGSFAPNSQIIIRDTAYVGYFTPNVMTVDGNVYARSSVQVYDTSAGIWDDAADMNYLIAKAFSYLTTAEKEAIIEAMVTNTTSNLAVNALASVYYNKYIRYYEKKACDMLGGVYSGGSTVNGDYAGFYTGNGTCTGLPQYVTRAQLALRSSRHIHPSWLKVGTDGWSMHWGDLVGYDPDIIESIYGTSTITSDKSFTHYCGNPLPYARKYHITAAVTLLKKLPFYMDTYAQVEMTQGGRVISRQTAFFPARSSSESSQVVYMEGVSNVIPAGYNGNFFIIVRPSAGSTFKLKTHTKLKEL